jgi:autotransporter-associated beta strand protein
VNGTFAFTTPNTKPSVGTSPHSVTFTPTDSVNYTTVTANVSVTVAKATPTIINLPTAGAITYGQTLASSTLSGGSASVNGTFAFTTLSTDPAAGTAQHSVTFTPTDSVNYLVANANVSVTVAKATPTITTPPTATSITSGQTLANSTLSGGSASVPGNFAFETPSTVLGVGTTQQSFIFTPTDSSNYNTVAGSVVVTTNPLAPVINSATTINGTVGIPLSYTINAANSPTSYNTSTLPSWLTLNSTTGVLSGTPVTSEVSDIILTASNITGTDTETLRIKIGAESGVFQTIKFLGGASLPTGGEIVDYTDGRVLTTNSGNGSHRVEIFTLSFTGTFTGNSTSVDLSTVFDGAANISSVSSVLADPRGFGVATVIPTATGEGNVGRIAIFDIATQQIVKTLDVGYHPDSVTITPDGTKLVVINEGEFVSTSAETTFARPGSISVVDISSVTTVAQAGNLTQSNVTTYDFSSANLASDVSISVLRNARLDTLTTKTPNSADIEPEYATATNSQVFVTLQENNAIAVFDFATSKYSAIYELGTIEQLIDASDRDGANNTTTIAINDSVHGLPMPDAIARFTRGGVGYLLTANEGDARPDDGDILRGGNATLTATLAPEVAALATNSGIGRLQLLRYEGDTNNDGLIDTPTMMGTRSFTIWNSSNGTLVYDSGSTLEMFAAANDPQTFNTNSGNLSLTDTRSDDKGPEPEAIAFATIDGKDYAFVGAERQNGIYAFDITDLNNVKVVGYFNTISSNEDSGAAFISPESIKFIHADTNPSGKDLLVVGYEGTGNNGSVGIFEFSLKSTPIITRAPRAGSINFGESLGNSILAGGAASVQGNFTFTAPNTNPPAGQSNQLVRFTPADTANYSAVVMSIPVFVINSSSNSTIINNGETASFTANQTIKAPEGNGTLLLENSTVTLQSNGTTVFSGNIEGNGGLAKVGNGTLVLQGNNSFSGPIAVTSGAIEISGNGTLGGGNFSGRVENNGLFKFAATSNQILSGEVVGSGEIVKEGNGTLTLAGNNSFNGAIEINSGAIEISGNGTLGGGNFSGRIENDGLFKFAAASNQTLSGEIVGSGEIVKDNSSMLVLAGNSTAFTGNINANDGIIVISGAIPNSKLTIGSDAKLAGTGIIGDTVVNGIIAPGNSPGSITTGHFTFNSGGNYTWEISDATGIAGVGWDQTIVNGDVTVNSSVQSPFTINVTPYGEVANWNNYQSGNWKILSYSGNLTGFDSSKFLINSGSLGKAENWSLNSSDNGLHLRYTGLTLPSSKPTATPAPTLSQRQVSSATNRDELKAIVSSRIQDAFAKNPAKVRTTSEIATILGVSKNSLSKIVKLAPELMSKGGKINVVKLEKLIRNNPKAAASLIGNSKVQGASKKSSVKK